MPATPSEQASLDQLTKTPYIQILTYPKISLRSARARVTQLRKMGIESLIFEGRSKIGRLGIVGIGTVGLVVKAREGANVVALKIRRTDANRPNMDDEFAITSLANRIGVGVPVIAHTKDFMLMKLLNYQEVNDWLDGLRGAGTRQSMRSMVHAILNQCRKLDILGIDHGQLSDFRKHIVIAEGKPWILDFESARTTRRPKNVTSAAQHMLVGGRISPKARKMMGFRDTKSLIGLLTEYKRDQTDYTYSKILEQLNLVLP